MSKRSESIARAEIELAQARAAVRVDYQAAKARLRAGLATPAVIGGVLAGTFAIGYLGASLRRIGGAQQSPGRSAVSQLIGTTRVLLPLLLAFLSASASTSASRAGRTETGDGDARE